MSLFCSFDRGNPSLNDAISRSNCSVGYDPKFETFMRGSELRGINLNRSEVFSYVKRIAPAQYFVFPPDRASSAFSKI